MIKVELEIPSLVQLTFMIKLKY
ncbi:uncharacterized protein METZ01_LOCUS330592 [marine metagenome]|uniref:Uncharacterized protein n=1 Tax=marine metagenome TaxID=408172 RepID=A0A382PYN4_9ZZZZ